MNQKYSFTLNTHSVFNFLRDVKALNGVVEISFTLAEMPKDELDNWYWTVFLETEPGFNISLVITFAYLSDKYSTINRPEYLKFKADLLLSKSQKFVIRGFKPEAESIAISGEKYNFVL